MLIYNNLCMDHVMAPIVLNVLIMCVSGMHMLCTCYHLVIMATFSFLY